MSRYLKILISLILNDSECQKTDSPVQQTSLTTVLPHLYLNYINKYTFQNNFIYLFIEFDSLIIYKSKQKNPDSRKVLNKMSPLVPVR